MRRGSAVHGEQHASDSICGFDRRPSVKSLNSSPVSLSSRTQNPAHSWSAIRRHRRNAFALPTVRRRTAAPQVWVLRSDCPRTCVHLLLCIRLLLCIMQPLSPLCAHATSSQGITDTLQSTIQSPPDPRGPRFCLAHQIGVIDVHEVRLLSKWSLLACIPGR